MKSSSNYYNRNAKQLFEKYQGLDSNKVHASWLKHLPVKPGVALDIGGGSGRDAAWLAKRGWDVIAVEPATMLFELGQNTTNSLSVTWLDDCLPGLLKLQPYQHKFSLILVNAVLMHLPHQQRVESMENLVSLMAEDSLLIITLRQGPDSEGRKLYQVPTQEIVKFAESKSLQVKTSNVLPDELKRDGITWQTIIVASRILK